MELSLPGTFAPRNFRSLELSLPGTFAPKSENDVEQSLIPNAISKTWSFRSSCFKCAFLSKVTRIALSTLNRYTFMPSPPHTIYLQTYSKIRWSRASTQHQVDKRRSCYLMHDNLHWLDVPGRVKYKVIILTRSCLIVTAPRYLAADCVPVSEMAQRRHLRSAAVH